MASRHETPAHRNEIDGLRAFAVLAILAHHAGIAAVPGGYLGVDIFFVISGFVITRLIRHDLDNGTFGFAAFYARRARRILPALVALLLVCLPLAWVWMSPDQFADFGQTVIGSAFLVPNIVLWQQIGYFAPEAATRPLLHLWSLGVEEQFYLVFPLLLWVLWPRLAPRGLRWALGAIAAASLLVAVWLTFANPSAGFYLLPARMWELIAGALAALSQWRPGLRARQIWAILGAMLMVVPVLIYTPRVPTPGLATVLPVLGAVLCLLAARPDTLVGRGLSLRPVVAVGLVSYGTYLWHWPLLAFARILWIETPPLGLRLGLMGLALGLGWASWRLIEQPFRNKGRAWPAGGSLRAAGLALVALAGLGGAGLLAEALGWRQLDWPGYQPAELAAMETERAGLIRNATCHFQSDDMRLSEYRAGWDCGAKWPVGVFGDSIARDLAMVLHLTGRDPLQMTGSSCSIVPSLMRPDCRTLAEDFIAASRDQGVRTVMLANLWQAGELTEAAVFETLGFWSEAFETVVLVSPLPRFDDLEEKLLRLDRAALAALPPDHGNARDFEAALRRIRMEGLMLIDATALFCADRTGCPVLRRGPLMRDRFTHLTAEGAAIYSQALMASGVLNKIVRPKK